MVSVDVKQHRNKTRCLRVQELCESRGGLPGSSKPRSFCGSKSPRKKKREEESAASYLFPSTTGIFQQNEIYSTAGSPSECPLIARSRQITPSHPTQRRRSGSSDRFSPVGQQHNTCAVSMVGSLFFSCSTSCLPVRTRTLTWCCCGRVGSCVSVHTHTPLVLLWKGWFLCQCTSAHVYQSVSRMTRTVLCVCARVHRDVTEERLGAGGVSTSV